MTPKRKESRLITHPLWGVHAGGVFIDALALHYEQAAWEQCFLAQWPAGSDAHTSYWRRIQQGPSYTVGEAIPAAA